MRLLIRTDASTAIGNGHTSDAARYITGADIPADGQWTAR